MSLAIVQTKEEALVGADVIDALRQGIDECGSAVLLVPSFAVGLAAQRELSRMRGLAMAVTTTTPSAWLRERWEVWGDGCAIAGSVELVVFAREVLREATPDELGPIRMSEGMAQVLAQMTGTMLPWLPLDEAGNPLQEECARAGLTHAERCLLRLAGKLGAKLADRGYTTSAEVSKRVPAVLAKAGARVAPVVVAGFSSMGRADKDLLVALSDLTQVTLVGTVVGTPASQETSEMLSWFGKPVAESAEGGKSLVVRDQHLDALAQALFTGEELEPLADGPVDLLLAAGPVAEAELVARRVHSLVREGARCVVVSTPNTDRAHRELLPKLVARGIPVRIETSRALLDCPSAQAFFSFAHMVAQLSELDATWPQPVDGLDGKMAVLGDMSWWPPRELSDFLLSEISHVNVQQGWRADVRWRGNRLLTPRRLLDMMQSERDTSPSVARATAELLRGRIGTAASKLLQPYVMSADEGDATAVVASGEASAVLQAILRLAGTLREVGVTADPTVPGAVSLSELVETCEWAAMGMSVVTRVQSDGAVERSVAEEDAQPDALRAEVAGPEDCLVHIMGPHQAASLAAGSVDALVVCGLTTDESPISAGEDLLRALSEQLGVEPPANSMAHARAQFYRMVRVPRSRLVLERALHDADAKDAYPSVMLSELLAVYGGESVASKRESGLPVEQRGETRLGENLSPGGERPVARQVDDPAPSGLLTSASKGCVFVPQDGSEQLPGGKPILSASQVETYLDCPYKWFSLRRLRLGTVDAGHGGMEMGTFAHRVLEVTHRELLARALEAEQPGVDRDELLAAIEANPARHVAGSRVEQANLEDALLALDLEFDLHQQHMYMVRRPRVEQQLLVAHNSAERAQEDRLHEDLRSCLDYQTRILEGFESRMFEWGFGRRGNLVEYAGAYFTGTIDRIDVNPHGHAVIIDYKHKSPVGFASEYDALQDGVQEGTALPNRVQSLIYAQVVRRAFEGRLHLAGTVYLSTKSPHALAGAADENVVDLVFGKVSSRRLPRVSVPRDAAGGSGMDSLLDRTEELVAEKVEQMLAGNVEARPRDKGSCDFCPVMQCERRMAR
ncbi:MAG: PD-(D/E)XK nuclease family protein [Atopobiaceae bacterium]|nr:PD-(D/E)XK nuclease family protein [Atopobiaceae bacterium]